MSRLFFSSPDGNTGGTLTRPRHTAARSPCERERQSTPRNGRGPGSERGAGGGNRPLAVRIAGGLGAVRLIGRRRSRIGRRCDAGLSPAEADRTDRSVTITAGWCGLSSRFD